MLIHMEDGSTPNILLTNQGLLLIVCTECQKIWTGKLTPIHWANNIDPMISAPSEDIHEIVRSTMDANPRALEQVGLTPAMISGLGI